LLGRLPECDAHTPQSFQQWYETLLWELTQERTDPRRNRINPRVIKQKMSKYTSRGHTLRFFERLKTQCEQRIECRLVVGMRPGQTVRDGR